jgi:hypothetical protein
MSHVCTISIRIKSLDALKAAVAELGAEWREGQTRYKWYGHSVGDTPLPEGMTVADLGKCSHAIHVPGVNYEIGVVRNKDGDGYTLACDFFGGYGEHDGGKLLQKFGEGCQKLTQIYAVQLTTLAAKKKGLTVARSLQADGKIALTISGGRL